eukprot:COSAG04_NODE_1845_length_5416_cov_26.535076_2_plen_323_part_00
MPSRPARRVSCIAAETPRGVWRPKIARYAYMARLPRVNFCIWRFEPLGPQDSSSRPPPAHSAVSASRTLFSEVCRWPRCGAPQRPALGLRGRAVGAAAHVRLATCRRPSAGRPAADCITPRRCKVAGADGSAANEMPSERVGQPRPGAARTRRGTRGASQATCARVCGTAASLHRHHAARHGCRGGGLGGAHIRRSDQPRTAHAGSSSRGAGAHNGAQEARGHLHVLRSAPAAGCREPGASPLRARPPGRQARAPCCPWALRRAGRRRPIAHERRGVVPGSLPFQGGRCGLRQRRAGSCGGRAAYPRLSTHPVPRSRLAHAY